MDHFVTIEHAKLAKLKIIKTFKNEPLFNGAGIGFEHINGEVTYFVRVYLTKKPRELSIFPDKIDDVPVRYVISGKVEAY